MNVLLFLLATVLCTTQPTKQDDQTKKTSRELPNGSALRKGWDVRVHEVAKFSKGVCDIFLVRFTAKFLKYVVDSCTEELVPEHFSDFTKSMSKNIPIATTWAVNALTLMSILFLFAIVWFR
jgi:hypothetical protein